MQALCIGRSNYYQASNQRCNIFHGDSSVNQSDMRVKSGVQAWAWAAAGLICSISSQSMQLERDFEWCWVSALHLVHLKSQLMCYFGSAWVISAWKRNDRVSWYMRGPKSLLRTLQVTRRAERIVNIVSPVRWAKWKRQEGREREHPRLGREKQFLPPPALSLSVPSCLIKLLSRWTRKVIKK